MAATVGWALLQAAVRAPPARLTDTHPWGLALPMAVAAPGAQGEAERGVEAQQVVVGIAEEVQQHLEAQGGWGSGAGLGEGPPLPPPHPGVPASFLCLSPPLFVPLSF